MILDQLTLKLVCVAPQAGVFGTPVPPVLWLLCNPKNFVRSQLFVVADQYSVNRLCFRCERDRSLNTKVILSMSEKFSATVARFAHSQKDGQVFSSASAAAAGLLDGALERFYNFAPDELDITPSSPTDAQLRHAQAQQRAHWALLLAGAFGEDYLRSAQRVGAQYSAMEMPFETFLAGFSRATAHIQTEMLRQKKGLMWPPTKKKFAMQMAALTHAFSLDLSLSIDAYFQVQRTEQATAFQCLQDGMRRMANKDLSQDIAGSEARDFPARFDGLRVSFNDLQRTMRDVIVTIKHATQDLNLTASEVNSGADDLAKRTESQAATLEQTASSVAAMSESVASSAEATKQTDKMMATTRSNAKHGHSVMLESVAKMREIAESSAKISQITGVIDDIAFQTNLLALNAGVEAARAGDAGRGFAVVAHEVRGLALRAAESAKEISDLIKESSELVNSGVIMVDGAGTVLEDIVKHVENVAKLTSTVAASSQEQSSGLDKISGGIKHLDDVTQQNAAMVEQTAAAVGAMQTDTAQMADLVQAFSLEKAPMRSGRTEGREVRFMRAA